MDFAHEAFQSQTRNGPDRTAVVCGDTRISYDRLNRWSNRIARGLRERGVGRETLVGVCLPRTEGLVAALLGVLKAGGAYVPLDPAYPAERQQLIREDARLEHMIDTAALEELSERLDLPDTDLTGIGQPQDAAYVIYTSGTTGRPKGAVTEHRHLANLLAWMRATYSDQELSGSLCAASVCHDFSVVEIFPALTTGGTVILAENMLELPRLAAAGEVTMISGVPSAMATMMQDPLPPRLTTISVGGEFVSRALADRMYANPGVRRVLHMYGPTECTTYSTAYEVPREGTEVLPLGGPVAGARLSIHDETGAQVPDGVIGELWVAGPLVVRGYLNRPDLTDQKFVRLPDGDRAYRTGDLVSVDSGRLMIHGRADDQVKVRGYRVELGEIEVALAAHPSVRNAVARAEADTLYAYVESTDPTLSEKELRKFLGLRLPAYMVPSRVAVLERFPLGPTGKADRRALAEVPFPEQIGSADDVARDDAEAAVAAIVAHALGRERVGVFDSFADLGGHSLASARVCAQIRSQLGVAISFAEFAAGPTVAELAVLVRERSGTVVWTSAVDTPAEQRGGGGELSDLQSSYWTVQQMDARPHATTVAIRLRLRGVTGREQVQHALDQLVVRHEELRTRFVKRGEQVVAEVCPPTPVLLTDGPIAEHRFDLGSGLLLRAWASGLGEPEAELTVFTDHIVFDGWSIGVVVRELAELLGGANPPLPQARFAELTWAHRQSDVDYWATRLAGVTAPHELGRSTGPGVRVTRPLPAELIEAAGALGTTPFCVFLGVLGVLVGGYTGRNDVLLGAPFARRGGDELDRVMGPLLGMLPVRLDVSPERSFRDLVQSAAEEVAQGLSHTDADFAEMVAAVTRQPGKPALPVILSMQPEGVPTDLTVGAAQVSLLGELLSGVGPDTVTLFVNETVAGGELILDCPDGWFTEGGAAELVDSCLRLLERGSRHPDLPLGSFALVSEKVRAELVRLGCPPAERAPSTVVGDVLEWAQRTPGAIAVDASDGSFTYAELEDLSARVASGLLRGGMTADELIGVCLTRSRWVPVALLGVLRAGGAYVPLDPEHPQLRRDYQIADCALRTVLTGSEVRELAGGERLEAPVALSDMIYVLYTSGSTGQPKGVDVERQSLGINLAAMTDLMGLRPGEVVTSVSPISFDVAHLGIWLPLVTGGTCAFMDHATAVDGHALGERLDEVKATVLLCPPTALRMLNAAGWKGRPELQIMSAGELMDPALAREIAPLVRQLWNGYGPTEAAVVCTLHPVEPSPVEVPIGGALPGFRLYVCDAAGRLVPPGVTGELWLAGPTVVKGYRNRPEQTREAFRAEPGGGGHAYRTGDLVRWRPDRTLDYLGRRDHQVKVRGFRVELSEVESVLREHPAVAHAAVAAHGGAGEGHLVGYVVWQAGAAEFAELEGFLRERLPDYMTPRRWLALESLPLNHNGKVDRKLLPVPGDETRERRAPSGSMETFLADAWATVLSRQSVYADDDFFALGGHSFAATRVVGRIWTALGFRVPVKVLFDAPVLGDFAAEVEKIALAELAREAGDD